MRITVTWVAKRGRENVSFHKLKEKSISRIDVNWIYVCIAHSLILYYVVPVRSVLLLDCACACRSLLLINFHFQPTASRRIASHFKTILIVLASAIFSPHIQYVCLYRLWPTFSKKNEFWNDDCYNLFWHVSNLFLGKCSIICSTSGSTSLMFPFSRACIWVSSNFRVLRVRRGNRVNAEYYYSHFIPWTVRYSSETVCRRLIWID